MDQFMKDLEKKIKMMKDYKPNSSNKEKQKQKLNEKKDKRNI